jgi:hypothetical protein
MIRKHFRLKKIALGLAFAAIVVPTAQAKVVIDGYTAPASSAAVTQQSIASEISVQSPGSQLGGTAIKLTGAALVNAPAPVSQAVGRPTIASEISVQSPVSQLQVEGLRWQAMARQYENRPGITAAGAALSNAKHTAYPVPLTQTQAATSDGFNWSDAGIGALVAFGAALMLLTAFVLTRRNRSGPTGLAST